MIDPAAVTEAITDEDVQVIARIFEAVEKRELDGFLSCYHPDIVHHEARALPYGGDYEGHEGLTELAYRWANVWDELQSSQELRAQHHHVMRTPDQIVVLYRLRGRKEDGRELDIRVMDLYRMRDNRAIEAEVIYEDVQPILDFLAD